MRTNLPGGGGGEGGPDLEYFGEHQRPGQAPDWLVRPTLCPVGHGVCGFHGSVPFVKKDKAETHARIVKVTAKRFRERGLEDIGVADVMKEAGVTVGGFYKHFGSRDEPVVEALATAFKDLDTAGVDVTVIRDWLGHESLDMTNIYARASLETKRKALEKVDPSALPGKPPRWKREVELLNWLDSL